MGKNSQLFLKLILPKAHTKNIQLNVHCLSREKVIKQCWNKWCVFHTIHWKYITIILITFMMSSLSRPDQLFYLSTRKKKKDITQSKLGGLVKKLFNGWKTLIWVFIWGKQLLKQINSWQDIGKLLRNHKAYIGLLSQMVRNGRTAVSGLCC